MVNKFVASRKMLAFCAALSMMSCATYAHDATGAVTSLAKMNAPVPNQFDWYANGSTTPADRNVQAQLIRVSATETGGSRNWVCSPAGFGRPSTCLNQ